MQYAISQTFSSFEEFNNGDIALVMSCPGRHVMHRDCHIRFESHERAIEEDDLSDEQYDGRLDGADICPCCRQMSHCATEVTIQNFFPGSGKTSEDAIMMDT